MTVHDWVKTTILLVSILLIGTPNAEAQGVLGLPKTLTADRAEQLSQSPSVQTAAISNTCSSISSLSRRCHFSFNADCKKRGESKAHCSQMAGFCHACTDAYATCKRDSNAARARSKSGSTDCGVCNAAYGRCIQRMVTQYGGTLLKAQ